MIKVWSQSGYSVFLSSSGTLYIYGDHFQQEVSNDSFFRQVQPLLENVIDVVCTDSLIFAKKSDGLWYVSGISEEGYTGVKDSGKRLKYFTECNLINEYKPVLLHTGEDFNWLVDENNKTYAFGRNKYGVLGVGGSVPSTFVPIPCVGDLENPPSKIVKIGSGFANLLVLLESGEMIGCGYGYHGELGMHTTGEWNIPRYVPFTKETPMIDFDTRVFHTLWLSKAGDLYFTGDTGSGLINMLTDDQGWITHHTQLTFDSPLVSFCCGEYSTVVATENKLYFSSNRSENGQLTAILNDKMIENHIDPKKISKLTFATSHGTIWMYEDDKYQIKLFSLAQRHQFSDLQLDFE